MPLRVNPDQTANLLAALNSAREKENRAIARLASGRRLSSLADDPAAAAQLALTHSRASNTDRFLRNVTSLRGQVSVADAALNNVVAALTRAVSLGVQGANGTLSVQQRQALAVEVSSLKDQVQALANTTYLGSFVFAGTAVTTQPFATDPAQPSGIRYDGNANVNTVPIAESESLQLNLAGDNIFADPAGDVFLALENLLAALQAGTNPAAVATATAQVEAAFNHVNTTRAFYGSAMNRLDATEHLLGQESLQLSIQEDDLAAADLAATISVLQQAQTARNAVLAASAQTARLSLFDFLK